MRAGGATRENIAVEHGTGRGVAVEINQIFSVAERTDLFPRVLAGRCYICHTNKCRRGYY